MIWMLKYFLLQLREACLCLLKGLVAIAAMLSLTAICIFTTYRMESKKPSELITVAIVSEKEDLIISALVDMANDTRGLSLVCSFVPMGKEEAIDGLKNGSVSMVMSIPEDFYAKASGMQEASLDIYTAGKPDASQRRLLAVMGGIEELMAVTEGAMYSMYDGMALYSFPVSTAQMEQDIFGRVISEFINRADVFDMVYISAYGQYSFAQHYITAGIILSFIISGTAFFGMYGSGDRQLERIIGASPLKRIIISMIKTSAVALALGFCMTVLILIFDLTFPKADIWETIGIISFNAGFGTYMALWLFAISEAVCIHLITSLFGSQAASRTIYWLSMLLMLTAAGVIVPAVYLPAKLRKIAEYIPAGQWHGLLMRGIWSSSRRNMAAAGAPLVIITNVILFSIAVIVYSRSLNSHD